MRATVLTLTIAMFATTAAFAQEKTTKASSVQTASSSDDLTTQKRAISGELKNSLATTETLLKKAKEQLAATTGADQTKHQGLVNELGAMREQLTEQLNLVNQATAEGSKTSFANARAVITKAQTLFEGLKGEHSAPKLDTKAPAEK